ncbi:hypothetical protein ACO2Q8_02365 [Larkinella sp. VNQ87]|uniref:hypothetical protein n=1 Tax=Larkinella sp. VNQ87 TaxID=3400921 RepID=UPI003C0570FF
MAQDVNVTHLCRVADALATLEEKFVFVGGATVQLYATDLAAAEARPTQDIDVVVALVNYNDPAKLEVKILQLGFLNDIMSDVICRYIYQGITVDIMPTESSVLGFTNKWYSEGLAHTVDYQIGKAYSIPILSAPYFLATKLEDFKSQRHGADLRGNSDFEDIVYLFDNRVELADEIKASPVSVRSYLVNEIQQLLQHPNRHECISVHLEYATASPRTDRIIKIWHEIINTDAL